MRILCTNDDGYLAKGLQVLASAAHELGGVSIVAPDREQSATSHSLTLHRPLRAHRSTDGTIVVDGTPTDCVILAINELVGERPDFCLSGVNHGPNMGEDVLYSGTVAAAMEATVIGIPAIAISFAGDLFGGEPFEEMGVWIPTLHRLLERLLTASFPKDTLLNVNLPPVSPKRLKGVKVTSLGRRRYSDSLTRARIRPEGNTTGSGEGAWIGAEVRSRIFRRWKMASSPSRPSTWT